MHDVPAPDQDAGRLRAEMSNGKSERRCAWARRAVVQITAAVDVPCGNQLTEGNSQIGCRLGFREGEGGRGRRWARWGRRTQERPRAALLVVGRRRRRGAPSFFSSRQGVGSGCHGAGGGNGGRPRMLLLLMRRPLREAKGALKRKFESAGLDRCDTANEKGTPVHTYSKRKGNDADLVTHHTQ